MLRTELAEVQTYPKIARSYSDKGKEISPPIENVGEFLRIYFRMRRQSFYIGFTVNVERRLSRHRKKEGAEYTKKRLPIKLIYCEVFKERRDALKREKQLKGWSRKKKIALICKLLAG